MKEIKKPQAVVYILCATTHMYGIDLHTAVDFVLCKATSTEALVQSAEVNEWF